MDAQSVVDAIRGDESPYDVQCGETTEVHDRVGYVTPAISIKTRTALAAAGRSRDMTTPYDDALAKVEKRLTSLETEADTIPRETVGSALKKSPAGDKKPATNDCPSSTSDLDIVRLRERVAELRGQVDALESCGEDARDERATLRETARRLSELETERVAVAEGRTTSRERRDRLERRMRLEDRAGNLARSARAFLVDELTDAFSAGVASLSTSFAPPTDEHTTSVPGENPFDADSVTAALAILRIARVRAPVVLTVDRFGDPNAATRWLDTQVVRL